MNYNTPEEREARVKLLFQKIALIAEHTPYRHTSELDEKIKPLVEELHAITQIQEQNHELDHKRIGIKHG